MFDRGRSKSMMLSGPIVFAIVLFISNCPQAADSAGLPVTDGSRLRLLPDHEEAPREAITALYQDSAGFAWIGTRRGLLRYDGYTYHRFETDVADPNSLADNTIRTIYEDSDGTIWIGTNTAGLARLDQSNWTFSHYRHDPQDAQSISHDSVNVIFEDSTGVLWVGTQIGLNRFHRSTGVFERIPADPGGARGPGHDYIYAMIEDHEGILWIGTVGGGLDRYDRTTGRFVHHRHDPRNSGSLSDNRVYAMAEDSRGYLWIGTAGGVFRFDPNTGIFETPKTTRADEGRMRETIVTALVVERAGKEEKLWLGTWGNGVLRVDCETLQLESGFSSATAGVSSTARVAALMVVNREVLWIGTWKNGVKQMPIARPVFRMIGPTVVRDTGELLDAVSTVVDGDGRLWVGTWGEGIKAADPSSGIFAHLEGGATRGTILALAIDSAGHVWAGSMEQLEHFDRRGRSVARYRHQAGEPGGLGYGYVTTVLPDADGSVWIGVGGSGLHHLSARGTSMERYTNRAGDPTSLSDNYITTLLKDDLGRLWVGTRSGGLNLLDPSTGRFRRFLPKPGDAKSISHHDVTSMLQSEDGALWIGTYGGGVNRLDPDSLDTVADFDHLTRRDGLVDDSVVSILEDDDRSLWFATRNGISRYDPEKGVFINFGPAEGLDSLQFNRGAVARDADSLYFGSTAGVAVIARGTPFRAPTPSPTLLTAVTKVRSSGEDVMGWVQLQAEGRQGIEAEYGDVLSFECAVLDFDPERRHRYAYRLRGAKDEWVELGSRREITFTNLDPGRYSLSFRGRSRHGVWSEATPELAIHVIPPFWMTTWFEVSVVFLVISLALFAHRKRTAKLQRHNRELIVLQREREKALREVEGSREELQHAYQRLRRLGRRLESAREDERQRIARELHDEMGQALTAVKINFQMRSAASGGAEYPDERANDTIALLDGMIERVRALSLDLRPPLLDELGLVAALRGYLEAQVKRAGIDCKISAQSIPRDLPAEVEMAVFRGVQEAVTNTIRHAEAGMITVSLEYGDGFVTAVVRDDGKGFDVDEALSRSLRGQHLGLLGMRERTESLSGRFSVESSPERGTRVKLAIPVQAPLEAQPSDEEMS